MKQKRLLENIYREEHILYNLKNIYKVPVRKDWVSRLYFVINPHVHIDPNDLIFESTSDGYSIDMMIEKWLMDRLVIANEFIKNKLLFDLLLVDIRILDEYDNFLIIFEPTLLKEFKKNTRNFLWLLLGLALIIMGVLIYINVIN